MTIMICGACGGTHGAHTESCFKRRKHSHYFKACPYPSIDVYRVLALFNVTDPCVQHAVKKLLVAGSMGGGKDTRQDIQEVIDTLERWKEMKVEEHEIPR